MIKFLSISTFRRHMDGLLKVRRGVYAGVTSEISREFSGCSIENIRQNRDMILAEEEAVIIKLRLPDKKQRLSRSNGYRLIYLVSKINPVVVFLDIYPKNGPLQKINLTTGELELLLTEFLEETSAASLGEYQL